MARTRAAPGQSCQMIAAINLRERKAREKSGQERAVSATDGLNAGKVTRINGGTPEIRAKLPETTRSEGEKGDREYPDLLSNITAESCNPQASSAFFTKLPAEVRREIYALIFTQYEIKSRAYPDDALYYRPGCTAPKRIDTAFLYTCRRAIYEARYIPLQSATHELWGCISAPDNVTLLRHLINGSIGLKEQHLQHMRNFHVYGSDSDLSILNMHVTEWARPCSEFRCYPQRITMTIPFTGWRRWSHGNEPELHEGFVDNFLEDEWPESLREICLRFETMEIFTEELDELVAMLRTKKIPLRNKELRGLQCPPLPPVSKYLSAEGIPPIVSRWTGPHSKELKERWLKTDHLGPDPMNVTEIWYYVVEASWKATSDVVDPSI